jgi:paraquat-inducible protein B
VRSTLENAKRTLSAAEKTLATDSPLQGDLREALTEVTRAAESVRGLTDYLERHPEALLRGKRPQEQK